MHFLLLVFALMLAMSTLDTLVNGIASSLATDMAGMGVSRGALMLQARAVTAVIAVPAIIVASQGFSVLYVFLIADLLGAAIAAPMLVGLYSGRMTGWAVLLAGGSGIIVGALFYPRPDLVTPMILTAPNGEQMFWSFLLALLVRHHHGGCAGPESLGGGRRVRFPAASIGGAPDRRVDGSRRLERWGHAPGFRSRARFCSKLEPRRQQE